MDTFRVRLNCVDHYQALPTEFDPHVYAGPSNNHGKDVPRVSVIRVFGATETGQKCMVHIHGVFQYCYVEYTGSLVQEEVDAAVRTLHLSIDHALAVSYRRNVYDGKNAFVAHISLVKGVPFYGYHIGYKFFFKIYLLNPLHMTRLADLLREGAVMKRKLQPYESHMQYIAQWMCDYNLYGCAYMDCKRAKFRSPVPDFLDLNSSMHQWHDRSIDPSQISEATKLARQSNCSIEVDICAQDISNRDGVEERPIHHDFIERMMPIPAEAKLVQSMASLWRDESRRRKNRMGITDPSSNPFPPEVLVSMSADPRNVQPGGWIHEEEFREKVKELATDERSRCNGTSRSFETFVKPAPLESKIKTALESVKDLYPENLPRLELNGALSQSYQQNDLLKNGEVQVDETRILQFGDDETVLSEEDTGPPRRNLARTNVTKIPGNARSDATTSPAAQTSSDGSGPANRANGISPISSAEYESLGIRKAGDLNHLDGDAFVVPDQYSSERLSENAEFSGDRPPKKRRLSKGVRPRRIRDLDQSNEMIFAEVQDQELPSAAQTANDDLAQMDPGQQAQLHGQAYTTPKSSQNAKLSFPVVKHPQDPNTILRLSQQSSQSEKIPPDHAKSSQSPLKSVSFSENISSHEGRTTSIKSGETAGAGVATHHTHPLVGLKPSSPGSRMFVFKGNCPKASAVSRELLAEGLHSTIYQDAYYSNELDVPDRQREYAGREFKLESNTVPFLPDFDAEGRSLATYGRRPPLLIDAPMEERKDHQRRRLCKLKSWHVAEMPPSRTEVVTWLDAEFTQQQLKNKASLGGKQLSQIEGPTQKNKHGFKYSQKQATTSVQHETQYMSVMSLEVHVNTRGNLAPNPEEDEIACVFWCVQSDDEEMDVNGVKDGTHVGILANSEDPSLSDQLVRNVAVDVQQETSELDLLLRLASIVREYDPDILTGYEVHNGSWGYLIERARVKYDYNFCDEISRMRSQSHGRFGREADRWGFNQTSTIRVTGRHTINIWRAMRGELNLLQYTMENVVFHLLHQRIPHYPFADLTRWYTNSNPRDLSKTVEYFLSRVQMDLEILEANELVPRTSEQARLLGVDFYAVFARGSQFKVESLMFRIAKPENFILVSPSRRQVGGQNALECLPLVMEPQSDFYSSPMLVLDFQSLYPSVMIAYNYCYSTFLGRAVEWRGTNKMGFKDFDRELGLLDLLKDHINIAPNGIMYAKPHIRKSLLAKMLSEILETRVMVKSGMKVDKDDKTLQRLLNNRQLALKLIANVTYGYTSASFSGRMPCSEIADSIVQTGRETLEKAIALIHSVERWGAEVVYGDTDSLFVYLKGRTREEAFDIGEDIAKTITDMNPRPVKLKFEKVYHPCVLLAKKRYVGFKYESRKQTEPDFDAKGIETVRRDGTPAEQKIEEQALKILFRTADLSQVKSFFQSQCTKIMQGKVSIQDFCFAKEVKLGTYSEKGPPPPGALISARRMLEDPRLEPQYGERVPYVVITGGPGARLIDRCVAPDVLLHDAQSELDAEYYISKNIIPPLERIFNLVGANVRQWYDEMPKYQRIRRTDTEAATTTALTTTTSTGAQTKKTLESYLKSSSCVNCRSPLLTPPPQAQAASSTPLAVLPLCASCVHPAALPSTLLSLRNRLNATTKRFLDLEKICRSCSGLAWGEEVKCDSKDCPVFYSRCRTKADLGWMRGRVGSVVRGVEEWEDGREGEGGGGGGGLMEW